MSTQLSKEVILHIGTSKTGTTSLQAKFVSSVEYLNSHSITYPVLLDDDGFFWKATRGLGTGNGDVFAKNAWVNLEPCERIAQMIESAVSLDTSFETYLFSSENLSVVAVDECFWKEVSDVAERLSINVRVIIYLRDPLPLFLSCYQQVVKLAGFKGSLSDFLPQFFDDKSPLTFYTYKKIKDMVAFSKKYHLPLETFRFEEISGSIVSHFFTSILDIDPDFNGEKELILNSSLDPLDVEFHRGINSQSIALGELLGWERSDALLQNGRESINLESVKFQLGEASQMVFRQHVSEYIEGLRDVLEFTNRIDTNIHSDAVASQLPHHEEIAKSKIFQLGQMMAASYEHGYLDWDKGRAKRKPKSN